MARGKNTAKTTVTQKTAIASKRPYLKQSDVPSASLTDALRIPRAIAENYGGKSTPPLQVAKALNVDPGGSQMKVLSGASIAFGLIEGGAQAQSISLTPLVLSILRPKTEEEDTAARREAVLRPRVFREFLTHYDNHPFPRADLAVNVLEDMGVPREKAPEVLDRLEASARAVGFLQTIKEKTWVFLGTTNAIVPEGEDRAAGEMSADESQQHAIAASTLTSVTPTPTPPVAPVAPALPVDTSQNTTLAAAVADDARRRKVFVTHGKDRALVDPIKRLLEFGELEPVVSVERSTVSKPVPEKVMDDMRMAGAAIIHVDAERALKDGDGNDHLMINPNVLIEIGAAMAFYGRRFILLVREGVALPSNLQGLFEVRYKDDTLDADATIRLLEAIREMKALPLPNSIGL